MDLLNQYQKENPVKPQSLPTGLAGNEFSFLVRLVLRLSGGTVKDKRQADMVLLIVSIIVSITTVVILIANVGLYPAYRFSPEEAQKQMEEYKKIQPF